MGADDDCDGRRHRARRRLRLPVQLPHRRARRPRRGHRLALHPAFRLNQRFRHAARPAVRLLPARPFGMSHPTARSFEPGTNIVATTRQTPTGWILVRDALTMGPREQADAVTPHTRPPADDDADHMWCAPSTAWREPSRSSWSASRLSTTAAPRRVG